MDGGAVGRVHGRSTVVTGAAKGIGKATAQLFAREGARLLLNDVDEDGLDGLARELRDDGGDVEVVVGDVAVAEDAQRIVSTAVDAHGRLDILVANAGVIPLANVLEATPEDYDHVMAVDGRGMWLTCKYAVEVMLRTGGGAIVCLSSISGLAGQKDQAAYGPAKFVASGITKHLAVEWAEQGIRVNAVAPGTILTEAVRAFPEEPGGQEYLDAILRRHPMGRFGEPAEVAQAILFLASDDASFVTGAILPVDGGYMAE